VHLVGFIINKSCQVLFAYYYYHALIVSTS